MTTVWIAAALAVLCALAAINAASLLLRRRLSAIAQDAQCAVAAAGLSPCQGTDTLDTLCASLRELHAASARARGVLAEESARRQRLERNLRESEERYALAISGGDDGMWEWNLKSGAVSYSPRWKAMLGYGEEEVGSGIDEWRSRIHPDDRDTAHAMIRAHLDGGSPRYEHEQRIRHRDGRYRWVLVRAQAVRNASGAAYRMVGLTTDITARHEVHQVLLELADGLADLSGEECYRALVEKLAGMIGAEDAFLTECCERPAQRVRMLARWNRAGHADCVEYDLAGTPCEDVIRDNATVHVPQGAGDRWPAARACGEEGYLGLPCVDTNGEVIGHIACTSRKSMPRALPHHAILKLFAVRAAVEMERQWLLRSREGSPALAASVA